MFDEVKARDKISRAFAFLMSQTLSTGARLTPFLLPQPSRVGVLVLPGGGYQNLATEHEGRAIVQWLNARGYDAWMLEYRVASTTMPPLLNKPFDDVSLALQAIRAQGRNQTLGVWGFSAGGHLAAMAATAPELKLDFAILAYPVIDFAGSAKHSGSRNNLLGENPVSTQISEFSPEERVSPQTPEMFLFHTAADKGVPPENSLFFAARLARCQVPFELHIYQNGPHGIGLADGKFGAPDIPATADWSERLATWLAQR